MYVLKFIFYISYLFSLYGWAPAFTFNAIAGIIILQAFLCNIKLYKVKCINSTIILLELKKSIYLQLYKCYTSQHIVSYNFYT